MIDTIKRYEDAGVQHIVLGIRGRDSEAMLATARRFVDRCAQKYNGQRATVDSAMPSRPRRVVARDGKRYCTSSSRSYTRRCTLSRFGNSVACMFQDRGGGVRRRFNPLVCLFRPV
jgi:hypothetical protein